MHSEVAGNSARMEKEALIKCLNKLSELNLTVRTLTTDRHTQIRKYIRENRKDIKHCFDVWHFTKSIKKKLVSAAKKKTCIELGEWIIAIINHLWWSCSTCNGDYVTLKEKWTSVLQHITNTHSWEGNEKFHSCGHDNEFNHNKKWLSPHSPAFNALKKILTKSTVIKDLRHLTEFKHSGNVEVFNALLLKYCPKRLHFSMPSMIARTELAVMDFNSGASCDQAKTKDGSLRYKLQFSRISNSWVTKNIKVQN